MWDERQEIEPAYDSANEWAQGCLKGRDLTLCFAALFDGDPVLPFFAMNTVPYQ